MLCPGVCPSAQVAPLESVRGSGTNTCHEPSSPTYRYGLSRLAGSLGSVVYGGFGKVASSGAPATPANTWFQTALVQTPTALSRTTYCCCDPLMTTWPSVARRESAMKPPLANCGPAVQ